MSKQLVLVLIFSLLNSGVVASQAEGCSQDDMDQITECGRAIGIGARPVLNATAMGTYCRGTGRTGNHCTNDYKHECLPRMWATLSAETLRKRLAFLGVTWDYMCSNAEAIENSAECANAQNEAITSCIMNEKRELNNELRNTLNESAITEAVRVDIAKRVGQLSSECIYSVLQQQCDQNIANVMGNIFYAAWAYVITI